MSHMGSFCSGVFFDAGAEGCFMEGPSPWPMISATAAELDIRNWCQRGVRPWIYMVEITRSLLSRHKHACAEEVTDCPPYKTLESALEEVFLGQWGPKRGSTESAWRHRNPFERGSVELSPEGAARAFRQTNGERGTRYPHVWTWNSICLVSILPCHLLALIILVKFPNCSGPALLLLLLEFCFFFHVDH